MKELLRVMPCSRLIAEVGTVVRCDGKSLMYDGTPGVWGLIPVSVCAEAAAPAGIPHFPVTARSTRASVEREGGVTRLSMTRQGSRVVKRNGPFAGAGCAASVTR